jgi:hypothetical protein
MPNISAGGAPHSHQKQPVADPRFEAMWLRRTAASSRLVDTAIPELVPPPGRTVFLAHAFTSLLNTEGRVDEAAQSKFTMMLSHLRQARYAVHCALEREEWGARAMTPETALRLNQDQAGKADYLVSFPRGSDGAFLKLGIRLAEPKPTLIVWSPSLVTGNVPGDAEGGQLVEGAVGVLREQAVPCALIEDTSTSRETFGATVVPRILEWMGQAPLPGGGKA